MRNWFDDESYECWDELREVVDLEEEEENDTSAMYFDVPLPYRPMQPR